MTAIRNRKLVLTSEDARHPFRQKLPPEYLQIAQQEARAMAEEKPVKIWANEDAQMFLFSFTAFFAAFYLFIF